MKISKEQKKKERTFLSIMGCFRCSGKSNKKLDEEIDNKNKNLNKQAVKKQLIAGIEQFPL